MFFLSGKGCSEFPKRMLISIGILTLEELVNEGVQKGRLEGIQAIVRTCKRLNLDEKHTVDNIMQEFPVSEEEATAYVKKYWSD